MTGSLTRFLRLIRQEEIRVSRRPINPTGTEGIHEAWKFSQAAKLPLKATALIGHCRV